MAVSIPEKTLEHWTAIDLHHRVPSSRQWWPVDGEDAVVELIRTAASAGRGSRILLLELKTATSVGTRHCVKIDVGQLLKYLARRGPSGQRLPVYYVFPVPHWRGSARSSSVRPMPSLPGGGISSPADWLDPSAGDPAWFGHWLYVLPAADVARALPGGWRRRYSRAAGGRRFETLFCIPPEPDQWGNRLPWSNPQVFARQPFYYPVLWPEFWRRMLARRTHYAAPWSRTPAGLLDPRTRARTPEWDLDALAEFPDEELQWIEEVEPTNDPADPFHGADDAVSLDELESRGQLPWRQPDTEEPASVSSVVTFRR